MGIYLGQLPPAEIARLKAELAETIIANFCYPRFFDYRTNSLRMRPVDRTKRQEVWLYLSSVDFTAWNRIDLMSPDLQRYIERLFIQFVQRNRNFFGEQGRKRMPDIRALITTSSTSVVQGLRNHVTGQRSENQLSFGSPRPVTSWSVLGAGGHADASWEQIAAMSLMLQQQLQEMRGEVKPSPAAPENRPPDIRSPQPAETSIPTRRTGQAISQRPEITRAKGTGSSRTQDSKQMVRAATPSNLMPASPTIQPVTPSSSPVQPATQPSAPAASVSNVFPSNGTVKKQEALPVQDGEVPVTAQQTVISSVASQPLVMANAVIVNTPTQPVPPVQPQTVQERNGGGRQPVQLSSSASTTVAPPVQAHASMTVSDAAIEPQESREGKQMLVGEDDIAIFEQLRHQMILWLRIEAVHAGIELNGQGPSQLLDLLRRQERFDETRLQVVSTLLNLANQVIKIRRVSVLDYKQALMFHLMHTRR